MSSPAIPQIFDTGKRVARTLIQVGIPTFIAFAAVVPVLLQQAHVLLKPELYAALLGVAGIITAAAGTLTRVMAIPAVNSLLARINLDGHSGEVAAADNYTGYINTITPAAADAGH
jgi:hypothetical protein